MKTASGALIALLASTGGAVMLVQADLYTFTLVNGQAYYYTSGDFDLTLSDHTYLSTGPSFERGTTRSTLGVQVDSLDLTINARPADLVGGVPWLQALGSGSFDGARVLVERFISDAWTNLAPGKIYQFAGRIGDIAVDRGSAKVTVVSDMVLLNQQLPRNVFQATCLHTLYDSGCALVKASFTVTGAAAAGSTAASINSGLTQADHYFDLGAIVFTSGVLNGQLRTIRLFTHAGGVVVPIVPFSGAPANGDTFSVYPGCNKVYAGDCLGKFANQANFRGMPFIPVPETAV